MILSSKRYPISSKRHPSRNLRGVGNWTDRGFRSWFSLSSAALLALPPTEAVFLVGSTSDKPVPMRTQLMAIQAGELGRRLATYAKTDANGWQHVYLHQVDERLIDVRDLGKKAITPERDYTEFWHR